jgi:pyridoxine 5-phosphate synthase
LNLESAVTAEMLTFARRVRPEDVCLVPERRAELTTEGGLDVARNLKRIEKACRELREAGIRVSLFIDPDARQVDAAVKAGAPVVELHTGSYAEASNARAQRRELDKLRVAAERAAAKGLHVNAGHGLNYDNVGPVAAMAHVRELNIGHAIIARSVFVGIAQAVREMKALLGRPA